MNADLRAELERHAECTGLACGGNHCRACDQDWPCDASRALEALDAAIQIHAKACEGWDTETDRADAAEAKVAALVEALTALTSQG